jgi:hypothetical protein
LDNLRNLTKDRIEVLEKELRDTLSQIMSSHKGPNWISDPNIGLKDITQINQARETELKIRPNASKNVIDYTNLTDLKEVILKNWVLFKNVFGELRDFEFYMNRLINNRTSLAHARALVDYEYHLVIGICGIFLNSIQLWKDGSGKQVKNYICEIVFFTSETDSTKILNHEIETWISNIDSKKIVQNGDAKELAFDSGEVLITIPEKIQPYSYMGKGRQFKTVYCKFVKVNTSNKKLLAKVIEKSNRPFRKLDMVLIGSLNLNIIAENTLSKGSRFKTDLDRRNNVTNISLLAYDGSHIWPIRWLWLRLGIKNDEPILTLEFEGNFDEGLRNLELINPANAFSYLYNGLTYEEKKAFINDILYPFNKQVEDWSMINIFHKPNEEIN